MHLNECTSSLHDRVWDSAGCVRGPVKYGSTQASPSQIPLHQLFSHSAFDAIFRIVWLGSSCLFCSLALSPIGRHARMSCNDISWLFQRLPGQHYAVLHIVTFFDSGGRKFIWVVKCTRGDWGSNVTSLPPSTLSVLKHSSDNGISEGDELQPCSASCWQPAEAIEETRYKWYPLWRMNTEENRSLCYNTNLSMSL